MNRAKKLISLLMALMMVFSMVSAVAEEGETATAGTHTITITNTISDHVYTAYQVFSGNLNADETVLSNIEWGTGVKGEELLAALKEQGAYDTCNSAADVAKILQDFDNNSFELDSFANIVSQHLADAAGTSTQNGSDGDYTYTISGLSDGYYFVKDTGTIGTDDAATKYIMQVVDDVEVKAKAEVPTLEKKIVEDDKLVDANNGAVGDTVNYQLTSKVPAMDGYAKYYFLVHDTLSKGLTYVADSLEIKVGDKMLAADTDYVVTTAITATGETTIKIVFKNFIQYKEQSGQDVVITYSATIDEDAVVGSTGNPNTAHLEYSNNPNVDLKGDNEPTDDDGDVTGETPDDTVITYVTELKIIKVDEEGNYLTGAEFEIQGEALNKVKVVSEKYAESATGTYYKLVNGSYTTTVPTTETASSYVDTTKKYELTEEVSWVTTSETVTAKAFVSENGQLVFSGLGEGTYTITEITAPDGYNKLENPITVTITCMVPNPVEQATDNATWTYTGAEVAEDGTATVTIENKSGATLPETGGVGTTMLYVGGGALIAVAVAMLVAKKRKA